MKNKQLNFKDFSPSTFSQTKEEIDSLLAEKEIRKPIQATFLLGLLMILLLIMSWAKLPPEVPLFYSRPWGLNQLAEKVWLWLLPLTIWFITLINLKIASYLFIKEKVLAFSLVWGGLLGAVLANVVLIEIIWLTL